MSVFYQSRLLLQYICALSAAEELVYIWDSSQQWKMTSPNLPAFLPKAVPSSSNPRLYYSPRPTSPYPMQRPMQLRPAFEFPIPTSHPCIDIQLGIFGNIVSR